MRIKVEFSVEIDEQAWADEYGVEGVTAIRRDAQVHAKSIVTQHFDSIGVIAR